MILYRLQSGRMSRHRNYQAFLLDPIKHGWIKYEPSKSLSHLKMFLSHPVVSELIKCGFSSAKPCVTALFSCSAANLPCTTFCNCQCEAICRNKFTQTATDIDGEESRRERNARADTLVCTSSGINLVLPLQATRNQGC